MIGRTLGHYRVLAELGAGGMGVAYLAHDEKLKRDVVLKVLPPGTETNEFARSRLVREAQTASALNHPYICIMHEVGEEDGLVFIAMEHIEGQTLLGLTSGAALPWQRVVRYGSQVAEALAHAHGKGIIHRDLKCGNVMVTAEDRIKVLDFGLAKRVASTERDETLSRSLAEEGSIAGTVAYMAPEVLSGAPADARSDIWALGVMLYEMSAGRRPFAHTTAYALSSAILRDEPPPLPPDVPPELAAVITHCLVKEPKQRYQNAGEVRAALEVLQGGTSATTALFRARGLRLPKVVWQTLALLAVVAVLFAYGVLKSGRAPRSIAVLPFTSDSAETEYLSDGLSDTLIESVSQLSGVKVISHASAFHYKGKEVDPRQVGRELNVSAVLTGQVVHQGDSISVRVELVDARDNSHLWGEHYTRKLADVAELQHDLNQDVADHLRTSGEEKRRLASESTATNAEAYQLCLRGDYYRHKQNPEAYEIARQYYQRAIEKDPAYVNAYSGMSAYYVQLADDGGAPPGEAYAKAKLYINKLMQLAPDRGHGPLGGVALFYDWDFPEVARQWRMVLERNPANPTPGWGSNSEFYRNYAVYLRVMGRPEEAIAAVVHARELDPLSVFINTALGWEYYYAHRYPQAIEQFRTSIAMDPSFLSAKYGLALAYQQNGNLKEAIAALQDYIAASGDDEMAARLAQTYAQSGFAPAMRQFTQSVLAANLEAAKESYRPPMIFASLYAVLGDKDKSFLWLEKAFAERSSKLLDLRVDPDFDNLRADPRFAALVRRVGLP